MAKNAVDNLGKFLKKLRVEANLSQSEVASALGYSSPQFISNFERGLASPPLNKIKILAEIYDCDLRDFYKVLRNEQDAFLRNALFGQNQKVSSK